MIDILRVYPRLPVAELWVEFTSGTETNSLC